MFYPEEALKRGGRFYMCWVADSYPLRFATMTHRQLWSQDIRIISDDLREVIINESGRPRQRFSLRLSSQLLRGLVRLYQRKVNMFLGELCRINATVIRSTNKKWNIQEVEIVRHVKHTLPQLVVQEIVEEVPENEQRVVELIQSSGNVVANIQDITLREPTEVNPEMLLRPNDGFGEENPEQILEQLQERSVEVMLAQADATAQRSALDLPLDGGDASHDRTHLLVSHARTERISDHDLTVFGKSVADVSVSAAPDFEKDIPAIPEIPPPELPVPVPEKPHEEVPDQPRTITTHLSRNQDQMEIELEEIEHEPQTRKRRLRNRLIIDKRTKINTQYFRTRLENSNVELRCENSSDDIIAIRVPTELYFRRPAHGGDRVATNLGFVISHLFARNLGVTSVQPREERELEEVMQRPNYRVTRSHLENIEEEEIPLVVEVAQVQTEQVPNESILGQNLQELSRVSAGQNLQELSRVSAGQVDVDMSDMLTQKVETLSQAHKRKMHEDELMNSSKRPRSVGYVSFRESQLARQHSSPFLGLEANKENRPDNIPPLPTLNVESVQAQTAEKIVSSMLQEMGLADNQVPPSTAVEVYEQISQREVTRGKADVHSDSSETPLGSLDRTKVSLGDSDQTTDSKRFIRDQWGTEGTMLKILTLVRADSKPVTVSTLVAKGPTIAGHIRIIAARCFSSILKLKQHRFINISKDPDTLEIHDITLGAKLISLQQQC